MGADASRSRARAGRILFGGAALATTGFFSGLAVAPLAAEDLTGAVTWSGLPGAAGIVGTAVGASVVSVILRRVDRRTGLTAGYLLGVAGAVLAFSALRVGSFPLLLLGAGLFGLGHAATQLTRYVVADLHEAQHRGRALGWIVWAGTIGGVAGPSLIAPAGRAAEAAGQPELAGAYAVGAIAMLVVALGYQAVLRPDPGALAVAEAAPEPTADGPDTVPLWRLPTVRVAITVMVTGQVVMVWLMSMTPVHIREAGGDLGRIGLILSAHIFGMYALAPLAGWVEDRHGSLHAIAISLGTLAAAAVLAAGAPVGGMLMGLALFLLGLGWSFGFVAGSTLLSRGIPAAVRASVQGRVETAVWLASATASLGAGLLLDVVGYVGLCVLGLAALLLPTTFVLRQRLRLAITPAA
ncbi:MAG TPA: MFS transporter [Nitriliruptorales bacterium]